MYRANTRALVHLKLVGILIWQSCFFILSPSAGLTLVAPVCELLVNYNSRQVGCKSKTGKRDSLMLTGVVNAREMITSLFQDNLLTNSIIPPSKTAT